MKRIKDIKYWINLLKVYTSEYYDYTVDISKKNKINECNPNEKLITIVDNMSEQNKLFSLLHEIGHVKIFCLEDYHGNFGAIAKEDYKPNNRKTNLAHFQKLKEEMFAWEMGIKIADELKIPIDYDAYDNYAAKCYMTYVKFAGQGYYQKEMRKIFKQQGLSIKFHETLAPE
jgi:hypothetical protein